MKWGSLGAASVCVAAAIAGGTQAQAANQLKLQKGDRIVILGNTLAERMQYEGGFETRLHARYPELELVVRNLGWSADELTQRLRSANFKDHGHSPENHRATVVFLMFGFNESFQGEKGLEKFTKDLEAEVQKHKTAKYNGETNPQVVVISPIAAENCGRPGYPDGTEINARLEAYVKASKEVAAKADVVFVDLYAPTKEAYARSKEKLTINGIHLSRRGDDVVGSILDQALFGPHPKAEADLAKLRAEVNEKNLQFFYDHRAVNGFYIYGGRKAPFGVVNFPEEFAKLRKMIDVRDKRVWAVAQGKDVPAKIDDSGTGELTRIPTNVNKAIALTTPEEQAQRFKLPEGFEITLFASEVQFPKLQKPVQLAFDAKGRMVVACMPSYPHLIPGETADDKILIYEDANGDGKADKEVVYADKLYLPTGIELGDGGMYVAQQPNLTFLKDVDGDDKADVRENVLHGFDSADSHHSISAFVWGPEGGLYFQEGTFHQSQIETPYGPERLSNAGVFRYEPKTGKVDVFVSYGFANPWGHTFDRWGQNFVADASGGANYFGTAFSGDVDYPRKHGGLKQFLVKQWRPTSGCELVTSRNFPDDWQGNYLLNNCIGFQGTLNYKMKDAGSGFAADPAEPLVQSADPNCRPVDLEFGPDGALYVIDWFNPLVGHMQHSIRDPNRDHTHGRIWKISNKKKPLVAPTKIAGEPIPALLEALRTYEDRTRYRVRLELRDRDVKEVTAAIDAFIAKLDPKDPLYEHLRLECLWVKQHHDAFDGALLQKVLASPDFRARAAATRVLCYWRDKTPDALKLLQKQVNDEHPRVRLEAVRALSFFDSQEALDIAAESLLYPEDDYLKYTYKETTTTLENRVKAANPKKKS